MRIHAAQPLFAWACLDDCPTLATIGDFLDTVPDQKLLAGLRAAHGHGRDDYPVERLWRVVLLTIAFDACLAELHRNPALCRRVDITTAEEIPNGWNVSRFLEVLGAEPHLSHLRDVFKHLARRLGRAVPDLGRHTAGDATALNARPKRNAKAVQRETKQGLPQPSGGKKEYTDDDGRVVKVVE